LAGAVCAAVSLGGPVRDAPPSRFFEGGSFMKIMVWAAAAACILAAGQGLAASKGIVSENHVFHQCNACHSLDPSRNAFGPSLIGVVGRPAGTVPRYAYSDAVRNSGVVWTDDNLRKWIAGNDQFIPGTRMRHVGISDKARQDALIEFLRGC
jgi:cytochrome c